MTDLAVQKYPNPTYGYIVGVLSLSIVIIGAFFEQGKTDVNIKYALVSALVLVALSGAIYFAVCVYRLHKIASIVTAGKYPVSASKAAWFNFIPFYNIYWMFKWPGELAHFLNHAKKQESFSPNRCGWMFLFAGLMGQTLPGVSFIIDFLVLDFISRQMKQSFEDVHLPIEDYTSQQYQSKTGYVVMIALTVVMLAGFVMMIVSPNFMQELKAQAKI